MTYRFILWDFDGTLADSLTVSLTIFNRLALLWNFKPVEDIHDVRKMTVRKFLKQHKINWLKVPRLTREFHRAQRVEIANVRLYPGVAHVLRQMHAAGLRLGILSSNTPENIQLCLQANGVADLFDFTAGCFKLLGKARGIKRIIKQEKLQKKDVLYIGDELRDIEAAHKAAIDVAAASWGLNDWPTLARAKPTYQITTPEELLALTGVWNTAPTPAPIPLKVAK